MVQESAPWGTVLLMPEPIVDNDELSYFNKNLRHIWVVLQ
jgi:hypothetical protein